MRILALESVAVKPDPSSPNASASTSSQLPQPVIEDYTSWAHKLGTDLNVTPAVAKRDDDPDDYYDTVQLMDEDHKFEGSYMEVKTKTLR